MTEIQCIFPHLSLKPTTSAAERGFTLIELSIVLVIIGLIIGGVLMGQDLIRAASERKVVSEIEQINTAVQTFRLKYNALPGDADATTAAAIGGSAATNQNWGSYLTSTVGNGKIEGCINTVCSEAGMFATHLQLANLIAGGLVTPPSSPYSFIKSAGFSNGYYAPKEWTWAGLPGHWLMLTAGLWGMAWESSGAAVPSANSARRIDEKIDDGKPLTGSVRGIDYAASWTGANICYSAIAVFGSECPYSGWYNSCATTTNPNTALYLNLDGKEPSNNLYCKQAYRMTY